MTHLDTKRVTSVACGRNFVIAMGQTLHGNSQTDMMPLAESQEYLPQREHVAERSYDRERHGSTYDHERHGQSFERHGGQASGRLSGRNSRSQTRDEHSPLRSKRRSTGRKKSTNRSTGRPHVSDRLTASQQHVHGNRHVGGCCHGSGLREKDAIP